MNRKILKENNYHVWAIGGGVEKYSLISWTFEISGTIIKKEN